jgi:hypothetical protein
MENVIYYNNPSSFPRALKAGGNSGWKFRKNGTG